MRGILPQLAGRRGSGGFFHRTQAAAAARTLGELVAKNAVDDPQLVDDPEASAVGLVNSWRALNCLLKLNLLELSWSGGDAFAAGNSADGTRRYWRYKGRSHRMEGQQVL